MSENPKLAGAETITIQPPGRVLQHDDRALAGHLTKPGREPMLTVVRIAALVCLAIANCGWLLDRTRSVIPPKPRPDDEGRR